MHSGLCCLLFDYTIMTLMLCSQRGVSVCMQVTTMPDLAYPGPCSRAFVQVRGGVRQMRTETFDPGILSWRPLSPNISGSIISAVLGLRYGDVWMSENVLGESHTFGQACVRFAL